MNHNMTSLEEDESVNTKKAFVILGIFILGFGILAACGQGSEGEGSGTIEENGETKEKNNEAPAEAGSEALSGTIVVNGSSTVYPVGIIAAEEFMAENPGVNVTVGDAGSGAGFEMYAAGEVDFSEASRPIKPEEEEAIKAAGMTPVEYTLGYDGITVVVNAENDFVDHLTVDELKKIWEADSEVTTWADVRAEWPEEEIVLYGPGTESGTYDFFIEAIIGEEEGATLRSDYTANADDNILVQGVAGDPYSLGFFGYAYYAENQDKLKAVPVDNGDGPVEPSIETISDESYTPLARPLFIYPNSEKMADNPALQPFVEFYLDNAKQFVEQAGYAPLDDAHYEELMQQFAEEHGDA